MVTTTPVDLDVVSEAVAAVRDPELPAVTIGMLGMVHHIELEDGSVHVDLLPTFAGCPATDMIRRDVVAAVAELAGVDRVQVTFLFDPVWTPERIDEVGRARLADFGIAPPVSATIDPEVPPGVRRLPITAAVATGRRCPWCQSSDTTRDSMFGPTPCRDVWFCASCQQPFEGFKNR